MDKPLEMSLAFLEFAVRHGADADADRILDAGADFISKSRTFSSLRGIDPTPIQTLEIQLRELWLALVSGGKTRVAVARNSTLKAISKIRDSTCILSSEAYEANLLIELRAM